MHIGIVQDLAMQVWWSPYSMRRALAVGSWWFWTALRRAFNIVCVCVCVSDLRCLGVWDPRFRKQMCRRSSVALW